MTDDVITLSGVTKAFGPKTAVRDLDLKVPRGSIYGFIGPNGAGKTTTIRMIMSIIFPDAGEIRILGHDSAQDARDRIGYMPEERGVYRKMKVGAFLRYMGALKGLEASTLRSEVERWLERVDLDDVADKRCEELSRGMQQKIQFLAAVIHHPDLLILDEPFSGLDPVNMRILRDLVREEHQRGATVIFSTHVMPQAEELCDHLVMIHDGRKMLDDSLASIRSRWDPRLILFEPLDPGADVGAFAAHGGVREVERGDPPGHGFNIHLADGADPTSIVPELVSAIPPARLELHRPTLEDVFIDIVVRAQGGTESDLRHVLRSPETEVPA